MATSKESNKSNKTTDKKQYILYVVLVGIILSSLAFRFFALDANPILPTYTGASWADEGSYMHNARNMYLFGDWSQQDDYWNPMYISPVHTLSMYGTFLVSGMDTLSARTSAGIICLFAIVILSLVLYTRDKKLPLLVNGGIIGGIVFLSNQLLILNSRTATLEFLIISLTLLVFASIVILKEKYMFISGVLLAILALIKITSLFIIAGFYGTLILYVAWTQYKQYKKNRNLETRKATQRHLTIFTGLFQNRWMKYLIWSIGGFVFVAISVSPWIYHNFAEIIFANFGTYGERIGFFSLSIYKKILSLLVFESVFLTGLGSFVALLAIGSFVYALYRIKNNTHTFIEAFSVISIIIFHIQMFVIDFPVRRQLTVIPFFLILIIYALSNIYQQWLAYESTKEKKKQSKKQEVFSLSQYIPMLIVIGMFIQTCLFLVPYYGHIVSSPDDAFSIRDTNKGIIESMQEGSGVHGFNAMSLVLESDSHKFYYAMDEHRTDVEEHYISLFENNTVSYALVGKGSFHFPVKAYLAEAYPKGHITYNAEDIIFGHVFGTTYEFFDTTSSPE